MKIALLVITYFTALVFFVFGLNFFLHFIPLPPMEGDGGAFMGLLAGSGFMAVIKIIEIAGAIMLAANFKRALAWLLLFPLAIGISLFEICLVKMPGMGVLLMVLIFVAMLLNKDTYKSILA